jgi:hypothetical protein
MKNHEPIHHRSPAHRRPPVQHETNVTRAYRLGKSETLHDFLCLLVDDHYSAHALEAEIRDRMHDLSTIDPAAYDGPDHVQEFQDLLGEADACRICLDLLVTHKLHGDTLCHCLSDRIFAAWPPDYLEYCQRYQAFNDQDPTLPEKVDCLDLRKWYEIVDSLHYVIDRDRRTGLPPSEDQTILGILLLRVPGDRTPCAE